MAKTKIENAWLVFGIIGILVFGGFVGWIISNNSDGGSSACASEFEHITTGTFNSNGKCCDGLESKSPDGFTGGAWCLSGRYDAKCLIPTSTNGINTQGIYAVERVQENSGARILLKAGYCELRCGGISGIQCPTNYNCELDNPTIADSMGTCRPPHI